MEECHTSTTTQEESQEGCVNYQGISLLDVPDKVLALTLLERLQIIIEPQLMDTQCGFRKGHNTVDQIWVTRQVVEKAAEYQTPVYLCFVDLSKAYNLVDHTALVAILKLYGVPHQLVDIIQALYTGTGFYVRTADGWCIGRLPGKDRGEAGLCVVSTVVQLCHEQDSEGSD